MLIHIIIVSYSVSFLYRIYKIYCLYNPEFRETDWAAFYVLHVVSLLGSFFDPEDEGDILLQNVGWLSTDYTALYPRRYDSSNFL
jgi:hypothetical protein